MTQNPRQDRPRRVGQQSEEIDLTPEQSPHIGAYFNCGIVAAQWVSRKLNITDQKFKPAAAKKLTEVPIGASIVRPTETTPYSVHRAKSANRQGFPRRQNPQPR